MHTRENEKESRERPGLRTSTFARKLLAEWKRLQLPLVDQSVVVAVSGGADSTALLLALDELVKVKKLQVGLIVAHLNHGLRTEQSDHDAQWVRELAHSIDHKIALGKIDVRERASESGDNLEQTARRVRYQFLLEVADREKAPVVLTGHTMDDQAETVLLRLIRGSGVEGLGGIKPVRVLDSNKEVLLVRPLLRWARRADTEDFCLQRNVVARIDAMNQDETFSRVRVRKHLVPLMETFNGRIVETLVRTASMLQTDSSALQLQAEELLREASIDNYEGSESLRVDVLATANESVRRRALRQWITRARGDTRRLELVHLLAVEKLLFGERGGRIAELPGGSFVKRSRAQLVFHSGKDIEKKIARTEAENDA